MNALGSLFIYCDREEEEEKKIRKKFVFDYSVDFLFVKRRAEMYYNLISHVE